jgi:diguanylate cyclase (GGDEF)-like protein
MKKLADLTESTVPALATVAKAARELAELQQQAKQVRATLTRLRQDVVTVESRFDPRQAATLVEANEQLVLTALRDQADAETSARALHEAARSAEFDALTELPNRALLLDRLGRAIVLARRRKMRLALLFLDLDNFKQVNDTFGHAVGDQVLRLVAHCLTSSVREADTVSRRGGDEFLILLSEVSEATDAALVADKVIAALGAPNRVGHHVLRLTASIGISIYPDDCRDADALINRADAAMYRAKRQGLGRFAFHDREGTRGCAQVSPPRASPRAPASGSPLTLAEHERRHALLQQANEQLVLAAIRDQELREAAERSLVETSRINESDMHR